MTAIPRYDVAITTTPYIGYAQAFNKIPFITRIVLSSTTSGYLRDVQVELRVRSAGGDLSTPVLVTLEQLGATSLVLSARSLRGRRSIRSWRSMRSSRLQSRSPSSMRMS
jgi:hypothetical protein